MFSVRCTKKLLGRMRVEAEPHPPAATTILAETPCRPIKMNSPDRETKAAFAGSLH
jgi:hypothetical protein